MSWREASIPTAGRLLTLTGASILSFESAEGGTVWPDNAIQIHSRCIVARAARAHQDGHVGLIDGVVVDMNVVGGVPQLDGDGALVVDEVVVDAGIGIAALVAADGVEGIAVVEETAARGDVAKDVVMHAAGAT